MPKHAVKVKTGPAGAGAYSQIIRAGDFVYLSGQAPLDPSSNELVGTTIEEQTTRVLENIKLLLADAGAQMKDVIKLTVHLSDMASRAGFNAVSDSYFPDPKPVRTLVGSSLVFKGMLVYVEVIAYIGS